MYFAQKIDRGHRPQIFWSTVFLGAAWLQQNQNQYSAPSRLFFFDFIFEFKKIAEIIRRFGQSWPTFPISGKMPIFESKNESNFRWTSGSAPIIFFQQKLVLVQPSRTQEYCVFQSTRRKSDQKFRKTSKRVARNPQKLAQKIRPNSQNSFSDLC